MYLLEVVPLATVAVVQLVKIQVAAVQCGQSSDASDALVVPVDLLTQRAALQLNISQLRELVQCVNAVPVTYFVVANVQCRERRKTVAVNDIGDAIVAHIQVSQLWQVSECRIDLMPVTELIATQIEQAQLRMLQWLVD